MLRGDKVVSHPVRERDLAAFINAHAERANLEEFFPLGVQPEPVLRRRYAENGFWQPDEGTLLIWDRPAQERQGALGAWVVSTVTQPRQDDPQLFGLATGSGLPDTGRRDPAGYLSPVNRAP